MKNFWITILAIIRGLALSVITFGCIGVYLHHDFTSAEIALLIIGAVALIFSDNKVDRLTRKTNP